MYKTLPIFPFSFALSFCNVFVRFSVDAWISTICLNDLRDFLSFTPTLWHKAENQSSLLKGKPWKSVRSYQKKGHGKKEEEKTCIHEEGGMICNHKNLFFLTLQMKREMRFSGSPPHSDEQGFRAACTWKRVGREGGVALGLRGGGGFTQPTLSTLLINLHGGIREVRPVPTHRNSSRREGKLVF